jgi:hypothetical protein
MQTSNKARTILFLLVTAFCSLFVFSCFSPWQGSGGSLTISIGRGNSRAVVEEIDIEETAFTHKIIITDSVGAVQEATIQPGGGTAYFSTVALGPCTVVVQGWQDGQQISEGKTTVDVKPGLNSTVPVPMGLSPARRAQNVAKFLRDLNYDDRITVTEDGAGRVIVEHILGQWQELPKLTLDIPEGVIVEWGIGGYHNINGESTLTLKGNGTLELTSDYAIRGDNGANTIFIESGSPTLIISGKSAGGVTNTGAAAAIKTAPGSSPNILISDGYLLTVAIYDAIVLLGGGTITVTGNSDITAYGGVKKSIISRGPNATVKGYYDTSDNKAYFNGNGGSWTEGVNLFRIP